MSESDGWSFWACGEFCGVLPNGQVRPADVAAREHWRVNAGGRVNLTTPRNGWASLRVVVEGAGKFSLSAAIRGKQVAVDLYREFYHKLAGREEWQPDALVPIRSGADSALPALDNDVPGQTAQSFWVDLFIPDDAAVKTHTGTLTLRAGGDELTIDLAIGVLALRYPDRDCIAADHNSYGTTFLERQYPMTVPTKAGARKTAALIGLIHKYHALLFEHHGLYHQLGFGHSGATTPLFAPAVAGDGRDRHVSDWTTYDAHYGPLLDGSASARCRRKARPVHAIYTPFNPGWPADYLGFGQPGYRVEMVNVLRDFDEHFRANGWTNTIVEYFFNHKKRYRFFEWDGDEPRYERDDARFREYRQFLDEATAGSPVRWRFRIDASWMQKQHWTSLAGVTDFWICGGFVEMYEKEVHAGPLARDDVVWTYSGGAAVTDPSADIIQYVYKTWIRDFHGNVNWLTTGVGDDPWFASDGARTGMMYPGERFGVAGPIPCVRLKVQRNAVQDLNLLQLAAESIGKERIKSELIPTIPIRLWREPPEAVRTLPPHEWTIKAVRGPIEPDQIHHQSIDPLWWQPVRDYALKHAQGLEGRAESCPDAERTRPPDAREMANDESTNGE